MTSYCSPAQYDGLRRKMKAPNKHLIALINYLTLVPLVYFIPAWLHPYLPENQFLQVCIIVAVIVPRYAINDATTKE